MKSPQTQIWPLESATLTKGVVDDVLAKVDQSIGNIGQIIAEAEVTLASLEQNIYIDVQGILDQVQCAAQNIATIDVEKAVARAIETLAKANISISVAGWKIVEVPVHKIEITDPDQAYISVKKANLKRLASLRECVYTIISTYANIERFATDASCAYRDPTLAAMFLHEEFNYQRLVKASDIISVQIAK